MRPAITLLVIALALAACASAGSSVSPSPSVETPSMEASPSSTPSPSPTDSESPSPSVEASRSLQPASVRPTIIPGAGGTMTGILGADAIEGGCAYLQAPDGTRYEVIWPDGYQLQMSPLRLLSPDGAVVARGGDELTVRGEIAEDMASICQIGPIFQATAVGP